MKAGISVHVNLRLQKEARDLGGSSKYGHAKCTNRRIKQNRTEQNITLYGAETCRQWNGAGLYRGTPSQ